MSDEPVPEPSAIEKIKKRCSYRLSALYYSIYIRKPKFVTYLKHKVVRADMCPYFQWAIYGFTRCDCGKYPPGNQNDVCCVNTKYWCPISTLCYSCEYCEKEGRIQYECSAHGHNAEIIISREQCHDYICAYPVEEE